MKAVAPTGIARYAERFFSGPAGTTPDQASASSHSALRATSSQRSRVAQYPIDPSPMWIWYARNDAGSGFQRRPIAASMSTEVHCGYQPHQYSSQAAS